jgi:hypothetical protein
MSFDWRATHHWLRGYSDAAAGKNRKPLDEKYAADYGRGYDVGKS